MGLEHREQLRSLFAVHPELLAPILQIIHRAIATLLIEQTGIKRDQAATGAVTLIQRFGSTASVRYMENWRAPAKGRNWPFAAIQRWATESLPATDLENSSLITNCGNDEP